ncbi:hypothetical protein FGO68_gene11577 [Halteria grandinella]|uniref:Uncharacterized protein n=1 Tax=Halteria grandinella TaxID=5974 RepID=A0A8J8NYR7_HALGN|nr:hypothetical protein FGO68_gene11577 [Halteria grandinella]
MSASLITFAPKRQPFLRLLITRTCVGEQAPTATTSANPAAQTSLQCASQLKMPCPAIAGPTQSSARQTRRGSGQSKLKQYGTDARGSIAVGIISAKRVCIAIWLNKSA